jgi:predicted ester cyclase
MLEENKTIVRKFYKMLELGDPGLADEVIAAGYISHNAVPDPKIGIEGIKEMVTNLKNGLPDIEFNIGDQIAERNKVVTRYTIGGTHQGELFGIPATGKQVKWTVTATMTVANGKIQEAWLNWDQWGLMEQLGEVPQPG